MKQYKAVGRGNVFTNTDRFTNEKTSLVKSELRTIIDIKPPQAAEVVASALIIETTEDAKVTYCFKPGDAESDINNNTNSSGYDLSSNIFNDDDTIQKYNENYLADDDIAQVEKCEKNNTNTVEQVIKLNESENHEEIKSIMSKIDNLTVDSGNENDVEIIENTITNNNSNINQEINNQLSLSQENLLENSIEAESESKFK